MARTKEPPLMHDPASDPEFFDALAKQALRLGIANREDAEAAASAALLSVTMFLKKNGIDATPEEFKRMVRFRLQRYTVKDHFRQIKRDLAASLSGDLENELEYSLKLPLLSWDDWLFDRIMEIQPRHRAAFVLGLEEDEFLSIHHRVRERLHELVPKLPERLACSLPVSDTEIAEWLGENVKIIPVWRGRAKDKLRVALGPLMEG